MIQVENLGKSYFIGHQSESQEQYTALRDVLSHQLHSFGRRIVDMVRGRQILYGGSVEEFWALKDVSIEVRTGEIVGIIGRNGAGKSTLLKVLSRITQMTTGRVTLGGRVSSLLEVGTGFHPELTGRENIFLNGAILGMSQEDVKRNFDAIVDFAEVENFLDIPVKRYSSGMYVRLAFAIAAHLEPEILIVDEVLAVGDLVFQKKCLARMDEVAKSGRTVLFVSHNMHTIRSLTTRGVVLDQGQIIYDGSPNIAIDHYINSHKDDDLVFTAPEKADTASVVRVAIHSSNGNNIQSFGEPMEIEFEIHHPMPIPNAAFSFQICNLSSQPVMHVLTLDSELAMLREAGRTRLICRMAKMRLYLGQYYLRVDFGASEPRRIFETPENICRFEVINSGPPREFYWYPDSAAYVEDTEWRIEK